MSVEFFWTYLHTSGQHCNTMLAMSTCCPLRCIQNAYTWCSKLLRSLWPCHTEPNPTALAVSYRMKFKLCYFMHAICHRRRRRFWRKQFTLSTPAHHTPGFGHPPPHQQTTLYHALPDNICAMTDPAKFRKLLKLHHFSIAFNTCLLLSVFSS